jgi:transketolase
VSAAKETGGTIITVEDHYPEGGIGEAVLSAVGSEGIKVHKLAVNSIPRSGKQEELLEVYGISTNHIVQTVKALI